MGGTHDLVRASFHRGGPIGCLLVHGFTCSPLSVKPLADNLSQKGYTVSSILLPGHGTTPEAMAGVRGQDWLEAVQAGLAELQRTCQKVWLVGFSMGGVLAAITAAGQPVEGLVTIAAPVWPRPWQTRFARLFKYSKAYIPMRGKRDFQVPCFKYPRTPLSSVAELMALISQMLRELGEIRVPALVVQGTNDRTIFPKSASFIYRHLGSGDKDLVWIEGGGHMLLLENDRDRTCELIAEFITKRAEGCANGDGKTRY